MTKKRNLILNSKLGGAGNYSLSAGTSASRNDASPTVNEILTTLRTRSGPSDTSRAVPVIAPSMPVEIRQLLDIPDTPIPRPRRRLRYDGEGRRLPPGPAPPRGWLEESIYAPEIPQVTAGQGRTRTGVESLPGLNRCPTERSLVATCLREMAQNWKFHLDYDRNYLATIPTETRIVLTSYVASYGPEEGLGIRGLKIILLPGENELDDFYGNEDFNRLDLSGSMGRSISFKQLEKVIVSSTSANNEEDDWESVIDKLTISPVLPTMSLCNLKFLSLANPNSTISWSSLLDFAAHLPLLTHLSLASWPTPCLTPNSTKATMTNPYLRSLNASSTNFYTHTLDHDWSDAANILHQLSRSLYSLEWLDLDGCNAWTPALYWSTNPCIPWSTTWRNITYVSLRSNSIPRRTPRNTELFHYKKNILRAQSLEDHIRKERGWITVEHDDWNRFDGLWATTDGAAVPHSKALLCEKLNHGTFATIRDVVLRDEIEARNLASRTNEVMERRREERMRRLDERFGEVVGDGAGE